MKRTDRIMRAVAFYFSVLLFVVLLPIVLSYALGYKIDYGDLKIYKTGIIYVNSNPAGASIYVNGKLHPDLTPSQIEELKPGRYKLEVRREGFYPWEREVEVRPNMVTRADRIVLFQLIQDIKEVSEREMSGFVVPDNRNAVYYMTGSGLFKSNMDGSSMKRLSPHSAWPGRISGKKFSPDGNKILYFDGNSLSVIYLNAEKTNFNDGDSARVEPIFSGPDRIIDAFWYSDSGYVIAVTEKDIKVLELRGGAGRNMVSLYKFNRSPSCLYYDANNDSIYFIDTEKIFPPGTPGRLYRMDLRQKFFDQLMGMLVKRETEDKA